MCRGRKRMEKDHAELSEVTVHRTMAACKPFAPLPRPSPSPLDDASMTPQSRLLPSGHTLLSAMCHEGLLQPVDRHLLQTTGSTVDIRNAQHDTPLLVAVKTNHTDIAQRLIAAGANVNVCDVDGQTPLYLACSHGNELLVRCLLASGAKVMTPDVKQLTLFGALHSGSLAVVKTVVEVGGACVNVKDQWGNTALIKAAAMGNMELCEYLIEHGADVTCHTRHGANALYYALLLNCCDLVSKLLSRLKSSRDSSGGSSCAGSTANTRYPNSVSPLSVALHRNCETCVHALLQYDPRLLNQTDAHGKTPLLYALSNGAYICNTELCNGGSSRECRHADNWQVVDDSRLAMVELLLKQGADIAGTFTWCMGTTFEAWRAVEALSICIRAMPLHRALTRSASATQVLFRQLALAHRVDALWLLVVVGYMPDAEDATVVRNATRSLAIKDHPARHLRETRSRPRTLRNLCVVTLRNAMPDTGNILYCAHSLTAPNYMKLQITAEYGLDFYDVFCD